jgi:hypothetical protein
VNDDERFDRYLQFVAGRGDLLVVDGSPVDVFATNAHRWASFCRHVAPAPDFACRNGKVHGVLTGLRLARHDRVVIADDDVRYDEQSLSRVVSLLDDHDVVLPQNYFDPCPWHAQWDTARTLINRCLGHDWPGTLALRHSALGPGGYDGNVLFENLELVRTVQAAGGTVHAPLDCYVRRLPPSARHFTSQRVRQAYDELARPVRFVTGLALVPTSLLALRRRSTRALAVMVPMVLAFVGRRRAGGPRQFSAVSVLFGPIWLAERGVCSWIALWRRLRGGCRYHTTTISVAAHSRRTLVRRAKSARQPTRGVDGH